MYRHEEKQGTDMRRDRTGGEIGYRHEERQGTDMRRDREQTGGETGYRHEERQDRRRDRVQT